MSKLTEAIEAKLAADGVSATAAAKSVGLSLPSFRAVMKGKSTPNARGLKKYAQLLGATAEEVQAMVGDAPKTGKKGKKGKKGKPGRKPGKKGKPGRKPGKKGKPGRKPGKKGKPGRKPGKGGSIAGALAVLNQAQEILGDDLAVAVHNLGKGQRETIKLIVANLG